jgi:hypothetical protein
MLAEELRTPAITRYAHALALAGIALPVRHDRSNVGTLLDAAGHGFAVVDMNRERSDEQVTDIAELIVLALNARAGYPSEVGQ